MLVSLSLSLVACSRALWFSTGGCSLEITLEIASRLFDPAVLKSQHPENRMERGRWTLDEQAPSPHATLTLWDG